MTTSLSRSSLLLLASLAVACGGKHRNADRDAGPTPAEDSGTVHPQEDGGSPSPDGGGSPWPDGGPPPADRFDQVLGDCGGSIRDPGDHPNQVVPVEPGGPGALAALHRVVLDAPNAVCNDGSPAVMYVRQGAGDDADKWVFHLQGGGHCGSFESCEERWCGVDYYDASKMSSHWGFGVTGELPSLMRGFGIHSADAENHFRAWNHVWVYYCSSDSWNGQGVATYTSEDGTRTFTMQRRGHQIVEAVVDALRSGLTTDDGVTMPAMSEASILLFNGTSGGSAGARYNADWMASQFDADTTLVLAAFDAAITPNADVLSPDFAAGMETLARTEWNNRLASESAQPFIDESCETENATSGELFRCGNASYFLYDDITVPFFVRQDLADPNLYDTYSSLVTVAEFVDINRTSVQTFPTLPTTAIEGSSMTRAPSIFAPRCAQHVGFESDAVFMGHAVMTDTGAVTANDALYDWVMGNDVSLIDGVDGRTSVCPGSDPAH